MRNQVELDGALQDHLFKEFVFADVGPDMTTDLAVGQEQSHAQAIDAYVVADSSEILCTFVSEGADEILRHAAQPEASHHNGGTFEDILDGFFGAGDDLVHSKNCK